MTEEPIFHAALERTDQAERAAYLDEACGGDADLRRRIGELLKVHEESGDFLEVPAVASGGHPAAGDALTLPATGAPTGPTGVDPTTAPDQPGPRPAAEGPGDRIGPYTLREKLGEGGMGAVYLAEQEAPIRRRVALKIIKRGMDTEQVVARFEAERQVLALMDHPNIARVLDAGATDSGRPFFVMELVDGVPVTDYCDAARLSPRDRLELFLPVCAAVQHAHQKGTIHRDIKPSNVLVAVVDGKPVPKVIDFGVAKAVDRGDDGRTLLTRLGAVVGTPEYMSPEQAGASPDVDTRTDVYSLGVLLYELLTGTTPLDRGTLRRAALDEVLRRVREDEPPKPSTRLGGTDDRLTSLAALRATEPSRLARLVRGDLDWVVMKALEKDRVRRYETPSGFARDLKRYLDGDPVEARPSRAYRFRRFTRKHRAALATASAFAALLVAATAVSSYEAWRATRAERAAERHLVAVRRANSATTAALADTRKAQAATRAALKQSEDARAKAEAVSAFLIEAFRSPDPERDGYQVKVADVLDRAMERLGDGFKGSAVTKGDLFEALGQTYLGLGLREKAILAYEKALAQRDAALGADHSDTLMSLRRLGAAYSNNGAIARAIPLYERIVKQEQAKLGADHPQTLEYCNVLAVAYLDNLRPADAVALLEPSLRRGETKLGPGHLETQLLYRNLARAYASVYKVNERDIPPAVKAERQAEALKRAQTKLGPEHPVAAILRSRLTPPTVARPDRGTASQEADLHDKEARLGPDHPDTMTTRLRLAMAYLQVGRSAEAVTLFERKLKLQAARLGPDDPATLNTRGLLAAAYRNAGRHADAVALLEQVLQAQEARLGPGRPETLSTQSQLSGAYHDAGRHAEEIALCERIFAQQKVLRGPDHLETSRSSQSLAMTYARHDRVGDGIALLKSTLKLREAKTGPDDMAETEGLREMLALVLVYAGRGDEAVALLDSAFRRRKTESGPDHLETLRAQARLGLVIIRTGRLTDGGQIVEDAFRRARGRRDAMEMLRWAYGTLARAYERSGRFADAEPLYRDMLALTVASHGPGSGIISESPPSALAISSDLLGQNLLRQGKWSEAEPLLRTAMEPRTKAQPDHWETYDDRSALGGALLGQGRYAEAEPLVVAGFEGLKARETTIPPDDRPRTLEAALRVVRLYEAWGKPDRAKSWKARLGLDDLPADVFAPAPGR